MEKIITALILLILLNNDFGLAAEKLEQPKLPRKHNLTKADYEENIFLAVERAEGKEVGIKEGKEIGLQTGIKMGILEEKRHLALEMIKENEPEERIIRYSGLDASELQNLRNLLEKRVK